MRVIKKVLHEKRKTTEAHIQQLQHKGKQGIRYTAMMPVSYTHLTLPTTSRV